MNKIILIGRSGAGKTTLTQALTGKETVYNKTQSIERCGYIIDTPGDDAETTILALKNKEIRCFKNKTLLYIFSEQDTISSIITGAL